MRWALRACQPSPSTRTTNCVRRLTVLSAILFATVSTSILRLSEPTVVVWYNICGYIYGLALISIAQYFTSTSSKSHSYNSGGSTLLAAQHGAGARGMFVCNVGHAQRAGALRLRQHSADHAGAMPQ